MKYNIRLRSDRLETILKTCGDEIGIAAVMVILEQHDYDALDTPEAAMIVESIKRSTADLGPNADVDDVAQYIGQLDNTQLPGFANNVKGIYHEMAFADAENHDGDPIHAELYEDTNHPSSDIVLTESHSHIQEIQLKATNDPALVHHALEKYPDTPVYVTSETAQHMNGQHMVHDSGFSNNNLEVQVNHTLHDINGLSNTPLDYIPHMALWSMALATAPVIKSWWAGSLNREQCAISIAKITGLKVVKVAAILCLLSIPVTAMPTSIYLIARISYGIFKAYSY